VRLSDEDIVRSGSLSSPEGIEAMYDRYGALAYTVALRILNDEGAAEDVVQEAFLSIWRRSMTFDASKGSLRAWLGSVVRNRAIDRLRGARTRERYDVPVELTGAPSSLGDPWTEVAAELTSRRVREALDALPIEQRQTLELAYYGGYSQNEIATAMRVPLGTVKGRVRIALEKLRSLLAQEQEVEWQSH
jgi:RNA polymerase sigma-70 factor, ECF subfamily